MYLLRVFGTLTIALAGCGDNKALDWSGKELKPQTAEIAGWKVEWQLPDGLTPDELAETETSLRLKAVENEFSAPGFYLSKEEFSAPTSLEAAVSEAEKNSGFKAEKKEETDDGYLVTAQIPDKKGVLVHRWIAADGAMVKCEGTQVTDDGVPNPEKTIELFEKVCSSVKLPPEAAPPSPDTMKAFLSELGPAAQTQAALAKYGKEGLATQDMEMYDLTEPNITSARKKDGNGCFAFNAKAGMTTRSYELCWEGDKIASVADLGMH